MNTVLKISAKNVYGNETIYPECDITKSFAKLLNQKTLTLRDLTIIKEMGFEFELINTKTIGGIINIPKVA